MTEEQETKQSLSELEWEYLGKTLITMLPVEEIQRFIREFGDLIDNG